MASAAPVPSAKRTELREKRPLRDEYDRLRSE